MPHIINRERYTRSESSPVEPGEGQMGSVALERMHRFFQTAIGPGLSLLHGSAVILDDGTMTVDAFGERK